MTTQPEAPSGTPRTDVVSKQRYWDVSFTREHDYTDTGSAAVRLLDHARQLERELAAAQAEIAVLQARIDELMLEYCPGDMTAEQVKNWEAHQQPVSKEMERTIDDSARKKETT